NELRTVARITEFGRTHVRGYREVVAEVVAVERAPSPSPPSHGGEGRGEEAPLRSPPTQPLPPLVPRGERESRTGLNRYGHTALPMAQSPTTIKGSTRRLDRSAAGQAARPGPELPSMS